VSSLKARYGDSPAMRRIVIDADRILGDVELLDTDVSELDLARATVQQSGEKIAIPDAEYDRDFWRDVDQEGVGGHNRSGQLSPPRIRGLTLCSLRRTARSKRNN
jgi:hypothetical protein